GLTLVAAAMWLLSRLNGGTTGEDLRLPLFLLGGGMGAMMMALNTHILSSAPGELVGRVTSLTQALQNVVASLAIASFATLLQTRLPAHIGEASRAAAGTPSSQLLADAAAFAFGDVYRTALVMVAFAWCLVWTLRRIQPAAERPQAQPVRVQRVPVPAGRQA
ncbi:MAG TPA: hypothetical protein VFB50_00910, partial [Chloroflexota bacterium]|nr:hypothetical protein [Chloroflexota bacterium]